MAISFSFEIAAAASDEAAIVAELARAAGKSDITTMPAELISAHGTWIQAMTQKPAVWNPIVTDLGFTPSVSIGFRFDKMGDFSAQEDDMARIVVGLLGSVAGDAVLHFQHDTIWLLRRGGELLVSDDDSVWPPDRLALLPEPYRRTALNFAD